MTLANHITFARLALAGIIVPLMYAESDMAHLAAIGLFVLAVSTDALDGFLARRLDQVSRLGEKLDPVVDKILIYLCLFTLLSQNSVEAAILFPMFIRDMIVDGLRNQASDHLSIGANSWGKSKFGLQCVAVGAGLLFPLTSQPFLVPVANLALLMAFIVSLPGIFTVVGVCRDRGLPLRG